MTPRCLVVCLSASSAAAVRRLVCAALLLFPVCDIGAAKGLEIEKAGTELAYFTHNGTPLLSFGGLSDFIFYAAEDAYDYQLWADWAAAHGMNHVRAYPPLSWKYIVTFAQDNGGSLKNVLFPYEEVNPGSRQFDLTKFDKAYWARFRRQCEYLQSKGIILHLLMWNGWQLRASDTPGRDQDQAGINWDGHFFNPANNVNAFTDHLGGDLKNRFAIYHSVADGQTGLAEAQKAWFQKLVEMTADLDNVYYDLVHELAEHQGDWPKTQRWIAAMATTIRTRYRALQPDRHPLLGMDAGGLKPPQRDWIFRRPYFDLLIYGKAHKVTNAKRWRRKYKKPYVPQESWDDNGVKYSSIHPEQRVHTRKYMWKLLMAKCQQLDLYMKKRPDPSFKNLPKYPHNYDPRGRNPFEKDAVVLRAFWDRLIDYPNLAFQGRVVSGPGRHKLVLSSAKEAVIYLSSGTGQRGVKFPAALLKADQLALEDGAYTADIVKPDSGILDSRSVQVPAGQVSIPLPAFTDDIAVHLRKKAEAGM